MGIPIIRIVETAGVNVRMIYSMKTFLVSALLAIVFTASAAEDADKSTINADVWADNWYALYLGADLIKTDSVPYNTERSFNTDSFAFEAARPAQLSLIIKDFKENDSGLEYIGTPRQQIGDGGFSAQFRDAETGELIAVSDNSWRCIAIHRAPLNKSCERATDAARDCESEITPEPDNWMSPDFDDSSWPNATVHSARDVRPHGGYDQVTWHPSTKLLWSTDLEIDNTVLCRFVLP